MPKGELYNSTEAQATTQQLPQHQPTMSLPKPRGRARPSLKAPHWPKNTNISRQDGTPGVDPSEIVGKVLKSIRRSPSHPAMTLHFADKTTYQIRIEGYDPAHPGVPKQFEMDMDLSALLASEKAEDLNWTVTKARMFKMLDKGFSELGKERTSWHLDHTALAFQCEETKTWYCVWVCLEERNEWGACVFRNYHDIYLERLDRSASPRRKPRSKSTSRRQTQRSALQ